MLHIKHTPNGVFDTAETNDWIMNPPPK